MIFTDNIKRTWKQIIHFNKEVSDTEQNEVKENLTPKLKLSKTHGLSQEIVEMMQAGIVTDERGVRVSVPLDEDAD